MTTSLETFSTRISSSWGPLSTALVDTCREALETLLQAPSTEPWMAELEQQRPAYRELYRHPTHGFCLYAYVEPAGTYRPPHDHGDGWVVYGVREGQVHMGTFAYFPNSHGLVRREVYSITPGDCRVYLPGDIHDTLSVSESLKLRLTSWDLDEELKAGRMTRFEQRDSVWMAPAPSQALRPGALPRARAARLSSGVDESCSRA